MMTLLPTHVDHIVDEVEYGRASSNSLTDAKEMAAHMAHRALLFEPFRQCRGMSA